MGRSLRRPTPSAALVLAGAACGDATGAGLPPGAFAFTDPVGDVWQNELYYNHDVRRVHGRMEGRLLTITIDVVELPDVPELSEILTGVVAFDVDGDPATGTGCREMMGWTQPGVGADFRLDLFRKRLRPCTAAGAEETPAEVPVAAEYTATSVTIRVPLRDLGPAADDGVRVVGAVLQHALDVFPDTGAYSSRW